MISARSFRTFALCLLPLALFGGARVLHAQSAPAPPKYEVYAVRFASVSYPIASLVKGSEKTGNIDIAFTVWVMKGGGRTVLLDAGFYRDKFIRQWKPQNYVKPSEALTTGLGIKPEDITDIIVSHSHWDHCDGVDLFPRAKVWIQKDEYEYYVGADGAVLHQGGVDVDDAKMLMGLKADGRVNLVPGDAQEILPGITVYTGGKHTFASQFVGVNTAVGTIVLASDNAYLYENLEKHLPIAQTVQGDPGAVASNLAAQDRMMKLAASPKFVIPGHDPAVFERFPTPGNGVARIDK
jgi:glyoxylase-like metal-dependent hydrolase (beta-lactamase superfamily II)